MQQPKTYSQENPMPMIDFPPVRAFIFDLDGLLINTSDLHTLCHYRTLAQYEASEEFTWDIKLQMQGLPSRKAVELLLNRPSLEHIPIDEYIQKVTALQQEWFPNAILLPGVDRLLQHLNYRASGVHMAIATSSNAANVRLKTGKLQDTFALFKPENILAGDDPMIPKGRGKPCPDIYLQALAIINRGLDPGEMAVLPKECLVLEDGIAGVTAGRRAGMRVVWVPHQEIMEYARTVASEVLAGHGTKDSTDWYEPGRAGDGWGELLESLENFPYEKYGIRGLPKIYI